MRTLGCEGLIQLRFDLSSNHTPSPGVTTARRTGSAGPVQGCRECGTVM
ncbi:MAG TPA: hypothetical protein PLG67_06180 [Bacillota bacterium]|nr:hypothetical protein [Bacillota bacterium]